LIKIQFLSDSINFIISNNQSFIITSQKQKIRCIVYIKKCTGRFGNRMFIVASAYGLARMHSCHLYITPTIVDELKDVFIFNLSSLLISSSTFDLINENTVKPMNRTSKMVVCEYLPELTRPNAIPEWSIFEMTRYWQSYLHFEKYGDEIREHVFVATQPILRRVAKFFMTIHQQKFGFTPPFSMENHQSLKKQLAHSNWITWIGVHVRREDFLSLNFTSSDEYLFTAIDYYTSLYSNAHFLVATDDRSYCENLFRNQSHISLTPESFSMGEDFIALSLCQHSIVTGGTFGWWTAYLANGQVIHDKVYPSGCERREYYYPPWFMIDGKVRARKGSDYVL
jgi:hypothetical protein